MKREEGKVSKLCADKNVMPVKLLVTRFQSFECIVTLTLCNDNCYSECAGRLQVTAQTDREKEEGQNK